MAATAEQVAEALTFRPWKFWLLALLVSGISLLRDFHSLTHPNLLAEDGGIFFAEAYRSPWWQSLWIPYAGYLHFLARVVAEGASILPVASIPAAYSLAAALVTGFSLAWFYRPELRPALPSDGLRWMVVGFMALAPHGDALLRLHGIQWYLTVWMAWVACCGVRTLSPSAVWALILLVLAVPWTSPATVVLGPVLVLRALLPGRLEDRVLFGAGALSVAGMLACVLLLRADSGVEASASLLMGEWVRAYTWAITYHLLVVPWVGFGVAEWILAHGRGLLLLAGAVVATLWLALFWLNRGDSRRVGWAATFLGAAILTAALIGGRPAYLAGFLAEFGPEHSRYFVPANVFLYAAAAVLLRGLFRHRMTQLWAAILMGSLVLLWGGLFLRSIQLRVPPRAPYFPDFASVVDQFESASLRARVGRTLVLPGYPRYGGIPLVLGSDTSVDGPGDSVHDWLQPLQARPDGFLESWWMGPINDRHYPWIYLPAHGFWCVLGYSNGRFWFYSENGTVFWTGPAIFPKVVLDRFADIRPISLRHGLPLLEAETCDAGTFFEDLFDLGGGWAESPWMGRFLVDGFPEITHPALGRVRAQRFQDGRYWFLRPDGTSFWTSPKVFPELME